MARGSKGVSMSCAPRATCCSDLASSKSPIRDRSHGRAACSRSRESATRDTTSIAISTDVNVDSEMRQPLLPFERQTVAGLLAARAQRSGDEAFLTWAPFEGTEIG